MKNSLQNKPFAQGDVWFRRCEKIPADATLVPRAADGTVVVAHSETQHHHSFPEGSAVELYATRDPHVCYLRVETPSLLEHHRAWDTHEAWLFAPGTYQTVRQRELRYTPEGWQAKMVQD
jgi:hypothetical protein